MENNHRNIPIEFDVVKTLSLADSISNDIGLPCVTDITCFAALVCIQDSLYHKRLISRGVSEDLIKEASTKVINTYKEYHANQEIETSISYEFANFSVYISKELYEIFLEAQNVAEKYGRDKVTNKELFVAFTKLLPEPYELFSDLCNVRPVPNNKITEKSSVMPNVPHAISGCLCLLNNNYSPDEKDCRILGRDLEVKKLMRILAKDTKRNAVLIGEPGVGKTALVEKLTWLIVTGNCPEKFKNCMVILLDVNAMIAGTHFRGSAEERFSALIEFLEQTPNCILFIDEIHNLLGAGACRDGDLDLANALKPILSRGKTQVIGATTRDEYERYFSRDGALKRRFEKIVVKEPKISEIYPMIENQIKYLSKSHNASISRTLVDKIIFYASCFNYETKNPDRTLDLIDKSMAIAELEGRHEVIEDDILDNFDTNKNIFDETPLLIKIALAYHEAGHYILHRFSDELYNQKVLAVSIMPGEGYYGVNVFEYNDDVIPSGTLDYYTQAIACKLAGRIAENMYSKKLSAGASQDLKIATKMAEDVVTKYGLIEDFSKNRVFLEDSENSMCSKEIISKANPAIDKVLADAWDYAENVLTEKKMYLDILVDALLESGMLSAKEIDDLFSGINISNSIDADIADILEQ